MDKDSLEFLLDDIGYEMAVPVERLGEVKDNISKDIYLNGFESEVIGASTRELESLAKRMLELVTTIKDIVEK